MLESLEKLLVLQDRDSKVAYLDAQLSQVEPQRQYTATKTAAAETAVATARDKLMRLESERKRLELEVESKKGQIERYSLQQFQTKKNEEYRALAHEIELARRDIQKLEDQQLEFMEAAEATEKELRTAKESLADIKRSAQDQVEVLNGREENLKQELAKLLEDRNELADGVEAALLDRYERLKRTKGQRVVVGINHGVCGGCHMRLPAQEVISCRSEIEVVNCPNCARILYYTRDMDLTPNED